MRLDHLFQLSFFVTLSLAACCLALAESFFLPWLALMLPLLGGIFVLAWLKEGVWVLGETTANYLGIVIALGSAGWILFHVPQTEEQILASGVPWPAGLLPQLAPLLLMLLAVKLFRPKRVADFWVIQTIGLMMVTLGCVLAYQESFGLMLLVYIASLLWCLTLFHFYQEQRRRAGDAAQRLFDPVAEPSPPATATVVPWQFLGLAPVASWLGLILITSMPLFLVLPRSGSQQWVPQKLSGVTPRSRKAQTGVEPGIDLYRVGRLEPNPEEAFSVVVRDRDPNDPAAKPASLPGGLFWRGDVLDLYDRGRWQDWRLVNEHHSWFKKAPLPPAPPAPPGAAPKSAPEEAPKSLFLRFTLRPMRSGQLVLAEPVEASEDQTKIDGLVGVDAHIGDRHARVSLFHPRFGCDALIPYVLTPRQLYRYGQELRVPARQDRVPIGEVSDEYRAYLLEQPVPEDIRDWTTALIRHHASLRPDDLDLDAKGNLALRSQAKVARVLTKYLATSGLFKYSLDLRRKDYNVDPTVDFLLYTKQGHCERYASGLALMLRGLGIPSRVIKGFREFDARTENDAEDAPRVIEGEFVVRQAQAHSWVQALVPEDGQWFWLNLDPTPSGEALKVESVSPWTWLLQNLRDGHLFWTTFILEYNNDVQATSVRSLESEGHRLLRWGGRYATWAVPVLALFWLAWFWRRRRRRAAATLAAAQTPSGPAFYVQYLRLLADRFDLVPQTGQTPLEFSRAASTLLCTDPRWGNWARLPGLYADALYRADYGGEKIPAAEESALKAQLAALDQATTRSAAAPDKRTTG